MDKPLEPQFIYEDFLDIGDKWTYICPLEEGRSYHIYLVGDWVDREMTDYDIRTYPALGYSTTHTESLGLPEQVANEGGDFKYYESNVEGDYRFEIYNDPRDSLDSDEAIFMIIEHIETDTKYRRYLVGRDAKDRPVWETSWAYEFVTQASRMKIFVDVPYTLDMYEVRLYPMACPDQNIGYWVNGVPVPPGSSLNGSRFNSTGIVWGGYNTEIDGWRDPELMASCEYSGQDMEVIFDRSELNASGTILYYLTLIAEYDQGEVEFYVQTDFTYPNVTIENPLEFGSVNEETEIIVSIESTKEIEEVWAEYLIDGVENEDKSAFGLEDNVWTGKLPKFSEGEFINYTIYARDIFGMTSNASSAFLVKRKTEIECSIEDESIYGDQKAKIIGSSSLSTTQITLNITGGGNNKSYKITTNEIGAFEFLYSPPKPGTYEVRAGYEGSESELSCQSNALRFSMESRPTQIMAFLSKNEIKLKDYIIISGTVTPGVKGLSVELLLVSPSTYLTKKVITEADGSFAYPFEPPETGIWNVMAKVGDDNYYQRSDSGALTFTVLQLTIFDKFMNIVNMMIIPPYLYATIGSGGLLLSIILIIKRESLASALTGKKGKKSSKSKSKSKKSKGAQRYRRSRD